MNSSSYNLKRCFLAVVCFFLLAWVALLGFLFAGGGGEAGGSGERIEAPPTMKVLYSFDAADPRELAGYSDAVFVGRALEKTGEEPLESSIPGRSQPQTQFEVEVVELVSRSGLAVGERIIVNQIGGVHSGTGETYVVAGVVGEGTHLDSLLEPGREYLLAVKRNEATGLYDISAQPYGNVLLSGVSRKERLDVIRVFERAAREPIENHLKGDDENPPRP